MDPINLEGKWSTSTHLKFLVVNKQKKKRARTTQQGEKREAREYLPIDSK